MGFKDLARPLRSLFTSSNKTPAPVTASTIVFAIAELRSLIFAYHADHLLNTLLKLVLEANLKLSVLIQRRMERLEAQALEESQRAALEEERKARRKALKEERKARRREKARVARQLLAKGKPMAAQKAGRFIKTISGARVERGGGAQL